MRIVFLLMDYWAILPSTSVSAKTEDWAAPLLEAIELQSKGEYVRAYELMRAPANKGNGLAQFNLALHHDLGWSRKRNQAKACLWYERAAKNNMPLAMQKYADCLNEGITAPSDGDVAFYWYQMAFQNGIYESACSAGKLLIENKKASRKDIEKGLDLCRISAEKGSIEAALFLGELYYSDEIVDRNPILAIKLFQLASPDKQPTAALYIAKMFDEGDGVQQDVKQAAYWYEIAAAQGLGEAYLPLAALYWELYTTSQQENERFLAKSYLWINASAALDLPDSKNDEAAIRSYIINETPPHWREELDVLVSTHVQNHHNAKAKKH
ncbi:MAG: tetratricopeptide repeat protein [Pseudomonadota bacterium]